MRITRRPELKAIISRNLCHMMREKHIYISTLVERTGISRNTILNIRRGRHLPSFDNAVAIVDVLGVSLDEFIREETEGEEP